jgi:hypothetical protein
MLRRESHGEHLDRQIGTFVKPSSRRPVTGRRELVRGAVSPASAPSPLRRRQQHPPLAAVHLARVVREDLQQPRQWRCAGSYAVFSSPWERALLASPGAVTIPRTRRRTQQLISPCSHTAPSRRGSRFSW